MHSDYSQCFLVAASYCLKHVEGLYVTAWSDFWWKFDVLTRKKGPATRHQRAGDEMKKSRLPDVWQPLTMIYSILKSTAALASSLYFTDKPLKTNQKYIKTLRGEWRKNRTDAREGIVIPSPLKNRGLRGYAQEKTHCEVMQIKPHLWR